MQQRIFTSDEIARASRVFWAVFEPAGMVQTAMAAALASLDIEQPDGFADCLGPSKEETLARLAVGETVEIDGSTYARTDDRHVTVLGPVGEPITAEFDPEIPF